MGRVIIKKPSRPSIGIPILEVGRYDGNSYTGKTIYSNTLVSQSYPHNNIRNGRVRRQWRGRSS